MNDTAQTAQQFLEELSTEERACLYNELLALKEVYQCNKNTSFYTFRKWKRAAKRYTECRKRTLHYHTQTNHELMIHQIHEQKLFKNQYRIQIIFDNQEFTFDFVEKMLNFLDSSYFTSQASHPIYA